MDENVSTERIARTGVGAAVLVSLMGADALRADTLNVPADHSTIQAAIDAASGGDEVVVAAGTYLETIDFLGKTITVRSASGPDVTTIDGGSLGSTVTFMSSETRHAVIEGFTITGGLADDGGGISIVLASPTIRGNIVVANHACFRGAGILVSFSSARIERNTISNNGGSSPGCNGRIPFGGGIDIGGFGAAEIVGNIIENNEATEGGAVFMFAAGNPRLTANIMRGNTSIRGGAMHLVNTSDADIINNLIVDNAADLEGGGVYWLVPSGNRGPLLVHNTLAGNTAPLGSAILADGYDANTVLANNAIRGEGPGAAVYCGDFNDLNPPQFFGNDVFNAQGDAYGGFCPDQTGSNGNLSSDPSFTNPANGDYTPSANSPLLDAGDSDFTPLDDIDGKPRPLDADGDLVSVADIGAYELGEVGVGVSVAGFTGAVAICVNFTTGERQEIRDFNGFAAVDCEAAGLTVGDGDVVTLLLVGLVQ